MNIYRGKYEVLVRYDNYTMATSILKIYNTETKEVFKGYLFLGSRKQYNKFFKDLDEDIIPQGFKKWIKPEDEMSEGDVERIKDENQRRMAERAKKARQLAEDLK